MDEILSKSPRKTDIDALLKVIASQSMPERRLLCATRSDMTYGGLIFNSLHDMEISNEEIEQDIHFYGVSSSSNCVRINSKRLDLTVIHKYVEEVFGAGKYTIELSTVVDIGLSTEVRKDPKIWEFINKILKG